MPMTTMFKVSGPKVPFQHATFNAKQGQSSPTSRARRAALPHALYTAFSFSASATPPGRSVAVTAIRTVVPVATAAVAV